MSASVNRATTALSRARSASFSATYDRSILISSAAFTYIFEHTRAVHASVATRVYLPATSPFRDKGVVHTPEWHPLTGMLPDYAVPRAAEVPTLILETMEIPSPMNPLGVKSIRELPTVTASLRRLEW
jgi:hypothetical protein